jgi:hypothetical protein
LEVKTKTLEDQRYLYTSKFLGGSAVYPKYSASERSKSIIQDDRTFAQYKMKFKEKLQGTWEDTVKQTQPYLFDPKVNHIAGNNNLPDCRDNGYKIGAPIVSKHRSDPDEDFSIAEHKKHSVFSRFGRSPKGTKKAKILLARAENGGFYNAK